MRARSFLVAILAFAVHYGEGHEGRPHFDHGVDLQTTRPLNIAHRGASGIYPEHSVEAFRRALDDGADVLECDVCLTKDLHLVCLHESFLNLTTDVASKFPASRMSTHYIPELRQNVTDWFSIDFTLEELKTLRVKQAMTFRDQSHNFMYPIATLEEMITLIKNAGRPVGLYPELKDADWVNTLGIVNASGKRFEDILLEKLDEHGYSKATDPCFIQAFQIESLRYLKGVTELPLVYLMWRGEINVADMDDWKDFYGIGPWKEQLVRRYPNNTLAEPNNIIEEAHKRGLRVHTYTFRNENQYLAFEYGQDAYMEYEKFLELEVDGFFTDFPHSLHNFLEMKYKSPKCPEPNTASTLQSTVIHSAMLSMCLFLKYHIM